VAGTSKVSINLRGRGRVSVESGLVGGRYALKQEIGRGGVGEVMLARDEQLDRWVAVKRLQMATGESVQRAQWALAEAKRLARLQHPNIVVVHDVLEQGGDVLIVMEYLSGYTIEDLEAPLPVDEFIQIARQSLQALGAAHALNMIHLDIKPTNIMLTWLNNGHLQVKLLDFGLATIMERPAAQELEPDGSLFGSVHTMAPEQFEQQPVGVFTDLYSLGCVFFQSLTGTEPFGGASTQEIIDAHLQHEVVPLAVLRPDMPPCLCGWIENLMARNPSDRPGDAEEALAGLMGALAGEMPKSRAVHSDRRAGGHGRRMSDESETAGDELPDPSQCKPVDPSDRIRLMASVGTPVMVEGVVSRIWENATATMRFINLEGIRHEDFSLVLPLEGEHAGFFRRECDALGGRKIRATGRLTEFRGAPQITIHAPAQIDASP